MNLLLDLEDGDGKPSRLLGVCLQQVVCDALRRLRPDAGQSAQLVEKTLERTAVVGLKSHD